MNAGGSASSGNPIIVPISLSSSSKNGKNKKKASLIRVVNCTSILCLALLLWIRILLEENPLGLVNSNDSVNKSSSLSSSTSYKKKSFETIWRHWWNRNNNAANLKAPEHCTREEMTTIEKQLPGGDCLAFNDRPWFQMCSFSYATRCHDKNAKWLFDFYNDQKKPKMRKGAGAASEPIKAVFVGCSNDGVDAVNLLRTMSANSTFDKEKWTNQLETQGIKSINSCASQEHAESPHPKTRDAVVHCIEPNPDRAELLENAIKSLGWQSSFIINNVEILPASTGDADSIIALQPYSGNEGAENCNSVDSTRCKQVYRYKLSTYLNKLASETDEIDFLSIEMQGLDWDVLLGGLKVLRRVKYVEFQYDWKGEWARQSLATAISTFHYIGFTCYWAGSFGNLWRITDCWLDYYSVKVWSHVACVNHELPTAKPLAMKMEEQFKATLEKSISYSSADAQNTDGAIK